jgi:tRNA(Ile)-lysidine synthase
MLDYEFDPDGVYLEAVTFGPESMALLDTVQKEGVKPIVLTVIYSEKNAVYKDLDKLKAYCAEHKLTFETFDASSDPAMPEEGSKDFWKWARKVRYAFFKEMYDKHNATAILIPHCQDDVIEDYLNSKSGRGRKAKRFSFSEVTTEDDMVMVRPLIHFTWGDLVSYCKENNVPFDPDVSYYEDTHTRTDVRVNVIAKMNEIERAQVVEEMRAENDDRIGFVRSIDEDIKDTPDLNIREIMALSEDDFAAALIAFVNKRDPRLNLTPKMISSIRAMCISPKMDDFLKIKGDLYIVKEYDRLFLDTNPDKPAYVYTLERPGKLSTPEFELDFSMGADDRNIHDSDYPLTIRTVLAGDYYSVGGYLMPARRMLMDSHCPEELRHIWPVFLNKDGKIVYIHHYRKFVSRPHKSVLKIKGEQPK